MNDQEEMESNQVAVALLYVDRFKWAIASFVPKKVRTGIWGIALERMHSQNLEIYGAGTMPNISDFHYQAVASIKPNSDTH